jgi:4-amino-4-deoxy-L-arabinose transferase-like glycosyltransferase
MARKFRVLLILCLLMAFYLSLRLVLAGVPLFRDEGLYAYVAQVIHEGGRLYVNIDDNKPPGLYMLYYLAQGIFGWNSPRSARLLASLFGLTSIVLIYGIGRNTSSGRGGLFSAFYFALLAGSPFLYGFTALPETFLISFISAGYYLYLLAHERSGFSRLVVLASCGFFLGLAVLVKQTAFFYLLSLFCFQLTEWRAVGSRNMLLSFAASVVGFLVPISLVVLYLISQGSLIPAVEYVITFNHFLYGMFTHGMGADIIGGFARGAGDSLLSGGECILLLLLVILRWLGKGHFLSRVNIFMFFWLLSSVVIIALLGVSGAHYFLLLLPPLSLCAGASSASYSTDSSRLRRGALAVIVFSFLALLGLHLYPVVTCPSPAKAAAELYHSRNYLWVEEAGHYIKEHSLAGDPIYVWSMEWELYFYSGRRSSSRHVNLFNIAILEKNEDERARALLRNYQNELIADLSAHPPLYVIYAPPTLDMAYQTDDLFVTSHMSGMLRAHYELDTMIGTFSLYRRKDHDK